MSTKTTTRPAEMFELGKVHPGEAVALFDIVLTDQADAAGRMGLDVQAIQLEPMPCTPPPSPLDVDAARNAPAAAPEGSAPVEAGQPEPAVAAEPELTFEEAEQKYDIQIVHTPEDGTLLFGSVKGDGSWQALRDAGHYWKTARRNSGLPGGTLYIHMSRDKPAKHYTIERSAEVLRAAGFSVWVSVNNTPRDHAQAVADRRERLEERAERLEERAERHLSTADSYRARHDQLSERFDMGQPILVGHHSERSARKAQERMHTAMRKEVEALDKAGYAARAAAVTQANLAVEHESPAKIQRKIDKLEADLRSIRRELDGYTRRHLGADGKTVYMVSESKPATGKYRENLLERVPYIEQELEYDRQRLAASKASGKFAIADRDAMKPGQMLRYWGGWSPIVRVNKKTVTVRSEYGWTNTVQIEQATQVREATPEEAEHWAKVEADHKARVAQQKAEKKKRDEEWAAAKAAREKEDAERAAATKARIEALRAERAAAAAE
ncbi:DUF3560 domain-containing protein [Amycolatopsis kentuckyensis]|uniref:DUF3560 domain-containing protein n=1 Tax=Amycolatopsis kentuckyensis TaxID=218823 RepID=UPI00356681BE